MLILQATSILLLGILLLWMARAWYGFWLNPVAFWVFPWTLVVTLFSFRLFPFEAMAGQTVLAIALAMLGFLLGALAVAFGVELDGGWKERAHLRATPDSGLPGWLFAAIIWIGFLSVVLLLVQAVAEYGFQSLLGAELRAARRESQVRSSVVLTAAFHLLLPAAVLSGRRISREQRAGFLDVLGLSGILVYGFVQGGRTILLFWLLLVGIGFIASQQRTGSRIGLLRGSIFGSIGAVLFTLVYLLVGLMRGSFAYFAATRLSVGASASLAHIVLLNLYSYATTSLASLNHFIVNFQSTHTLGTAVAHPITDQLARLDIVKVRFFQGVGQEAANTVGGSNVYSILRAFYQDLGLAGCFFFPFLLGISTSFAYAAYRRNGSLGALIALGYLGVLSVASPYEYMLYSSIHFFAFLLVGALVLRPGYWLPLRKT